ncbi:Crp/Fnr family transcriptional regulator [Ottowia sp.]|uniref:Crp/Fnr family transcriptional regulator n=1 Tax=Ottowia sp. TaxID=1898956 RepID=UPI00262F6957|nr:Crp/Fnr family transcriptional regulator [Ottowia sp.]
MLAPKSFRVTGETTVHEAGSVLQRRGTVLTHVLHLDSGKVAVGLADQETMAHEHGTMAHAMGSLDAPFWLNAGCAILHQRAVVDIVATTRVEVLRVPVASFEAGLKSLPTAAFDLLRDVALAHRHQAELAVSRLGKDAEARCAEWLLRHAEPAASQPGALAVFLRERKRQIAAQLGIAPETFSRVLRQLRERSLISGSGRVLNLIDPGGLKALAGT